jgi:hypothetical protein
MQPGALKGGAPCLPCPRGPWPDGWGWGSPPPPPGTGTGTPTVAPPGRRADRGAAAAAVVARLEAGGAGAAPVTEPSWSPHSHNPQRRDI